MAEKTGNAATLRRAVFDLLERGRRQDLRYRAFDAAMVLLIVANVAATVLDTVPEISATYGAALTLFDRFCVAIFIAEYVARLWTAPEHPIFMHDRPLACRQRLAATPSMVLDLICILPSLLEMLFPAYAATFKLFRLLRFLRLARYSPALITIGQVVAAERRSLLACVVLFVGLMLAAAVTIHVVEGRLQPDRLGDLPSAMWWAVVVMTKLGQTDVVPHTLLGKLAAAVVMLLGIGFFALPVAIIGRGFYDEIRRRDFVVTFGMVARVPLFSRLNAAMIAELIGLLHARKVASNTVIIRKGENADAMYLIASGQVEVALAQGNVMLEDGEFFGEMALLSRGRRTATVTARRPTELLVLDAEDFDRLMDRNPEVAETIHAVAGARSGERKDPPSDQPKSVGLPQSSE